MNILGLRCLFGAYENLRLKFFIEFGTCCFRLFSVIAYGVKRVSESRLQCLVLRCLVRDTGRQKMLSKLSVLIHICFINMQLYLEYSLKSA